MTARLPLALLIALLLPAWAQASRLLRPNPADLSEVSSFRAEWCAPVTASLTAATACFGRASFQGLGVRAIELRARGGARELYLESSLPGVELLKPRFGLVGPLGAGRAAGMGECSLTFGSDGSVEAFRAWLPGHGPVAATRARQ